MSGGETSGPLFVRYVIRSRTGPSTLCTLPVCVMAGKSSFQQTGNLGFFPYFSGPGIACTKGF